MDKNYKYIYLSDDNSWLRSGTEFVIKDVDGKSMLYNEEVGYINAFGLENSFVQVDQNYESKGLQGNGITTIELYEGGFKLGQYSVENGYGRRIKKAIESHSGFQNYAIAQRAIERIQSVLTECFAEDIEMQKLTKLKN